MTFKTNLSIVDGNMARLFGTNGIRGIFGKTLTLDFVSDITLSIASFFKKGPILIGYDGRESSVIISKIVSAAIGSTEMDCAVCGLIQILGLQLALGTFRYSVVIRVN